MWPVSRVKSIDLCVTWFTKADYIKVSPQRVIFSQAGCRREGHRIVCAIRRRGAWLCTSALLLLAFATADLAIIDFPASSALKNLPWRLTLAHLPVCGSRVEAVRLAQIYICLRHDLLGKEFKSLKYKRYHGVHTQCLWNSSFWGESALLSANDLLTWIWTISGIKLSLVGSHREFALSICRRLDVG